MENCIFCAIAQGKIPAYTVYNDDKFIAFLDINPANEGHLVISPKAHFTTVMEMNLDDYSQFFMLARVLALALLEFGAEGVNFLHSIGEAAGQRIPHAILHVIPRYKSDKVHLIWDPQKLDDAKLAELRGRIAGLIKSPSAPRQPAEVQKQPEQIQPELEQPKVYSLKPKTGGYW